MTNTINLHYNETESSQISNIIPHQYNGQTFVIQVDQNESNRLIFSIFIEKIKRVTYAAYNDKGEFSYSIYLNDQFRRNGLGRHTFQLAKDLNSDLFKHTTTAIGNWATGTNYTSFTDYFKETSPNYSIPLLDSKTKFDHLDPQIKQNLLNAAEKTFSGKMYWETFGFTIVYSFL